MSDSMLNLQRTTCRPMSWINAKALSASIFSVCRQFIAAHKILCSPWICARASTYLVIYTRGLLLRLILTFDCCHRLYNKCLYNTCRQKYCVGDAVASSSSINGKNSNSSRCFSSMLLKIFLLQRSLKKALKMRTANAGTPNTAKNLHSITVFSYCKLCNVNRKCMRAYWYYKRSEQYALTLNTQRAS